MRSGFGGRGVVGGRSVAGKPLVAGSDALGNRDIRVGWRLLVVDLGVPSQERGENRGLEVEASVSGRKLLLRLNFRAEVDKRLLRGGLGLLHDFGGSNWGAGLRDILDGNRPGCHLLLAQLGNAKLELLLGLGGTVELLVHGDVLLVEGNVRTSRV